MSTIPDRHPKRTLGDSLNLNAEPRVAVRSTASQTRKLVKSHKRDDPLELIGMHAERSKEQVDALEKMLHIAMPPRVVLDNTFAGLRDAIASDIQTALEVQFARGVKHGEWLQQQRIYDLEAKLNEAKDGAFLPIEDDADLASELAKFLSDIPDQDDMIDLNSLTREIENITSVF
jgi:hypothetical protein